MGVPVLPSLFCRLCSEEAVSRQSEIVDERRLYTLSAYRLDGWAGRAHLFMKPRGLRYLSAVPGLSLHIFRVDGPSRLVFFSSLFFSRDRRRRHVDCSSPSQQPSLTVEIGAPVFSRLLE